MLPIRFESLDDLRNPDGIVRYHAVVARLGEILHAKIKRRDERRFPVNHDRLLVSYVELRVRPLNTDSILFEKIKSFIVGAVATRSLGIEHHPCLHAGLLAIHYRLEQARLGKRELLD